MRRTLSATGRGVLRENLRGLCVLFALTLSFGCARSYAQDAPTAATPSTAPAAGTVLTSGAPTIAHPDAAPQQPVAFSHKKHMADAKMACNDCHAPSRNGDTVAIPQPAKCMLCHAAIAADKPDIQRIAAAAKNNEVMQWVRVYRVPSFVTFSHKTHTSAGATCEDCHGPVAEREAISKEKDLSMGGCISCHTQKAAPTGCDTCHQLNSVHLQQPAQDQDAALVAMLARETNQVAQYLRTMTGAPLQTDKLTAPRVDEVVRLAISSVRP